MISKVAVLTHLPQLSSHQYPLSQLPHQYSRPRHRSSHALLMSICHSHNRYHLQPSSVIPATQNSKENTRSRVYVRAPPGNMETSGREIKILAPPPRATQRPCKRYTDVDRMLLVSHINPRYPVPRKDPSVHVLHEDNYEGSQDLHGRWMGSLRHLLQKTDSSVKIPGLGHDRL